MIVASVLVVIGLVLLGKAADEFVAGAVRIATILQISPVVIGAVVIGFGTSAPEMFVSGIAAGQGDLDIGVGNIVGSNTANLTLVLGAAALVWPVLIPNGVLRREAPLSVGSVVVFALLVQGGLSRLEGVVLAVLLAGALFTILRSSAGGASEEIEDLLGEDPPQLTVEAVRTVLGLVGTVGGAALLIEGARDIALELGFSEGFVGLTVIAIGTSLPELVTSVIAARKHHTDLIVGNLLGSNLFNSLAVGAITGVVGDGPLSDPDLAGLPIVVMTAVAVLTAVLMWTRRRVDRWEGILFLVVYLGTLPLMPR